MSTACNSKLVKKHFGANNACNKQIELRQIKPTSNDSCGFWIRWKPNRIPMTQLMTPSSHHGGAGRGKQLKSGICAPWALFSLETCLKTMEIDEKLFFAIPKCTEFKFAGRAVDKKRFLPKCTFSHGPQLATNRKDID